MKTKVLSLFAICAMATIFLLLCTPANAQYRTSIQGTVTDPTGAVIAGANLTLKDLQTDQVTTRTSDASGVFNFNALPPNHFDLTVEKSGFQKNVLTDIQLIPEQANSVNVVMQPGGSTETVTVSGNTVPAIDTETANTQTSISDNELQHLPIYQRDPTSLIRLAPGVLSDAAQSAGGGGYQAPGTQTGASSGGGGNLGHSSSIFATENGASANTNGGQFENNGYTVDGISTVSAVWGGATIITPSPESIGDLKIVSNAYDAENGRFSGALVDLITKSGTNRLHGSFFFQIVRPGLNAYQRWNGPQSVQAYNPTTGQKLTPAERGLLRDEDRYNQWGGSIGGPIWRDKIFAFFAYEKQAQTIQATSVQWYTTSQFNGLAPANSIAATFTGFPGANVVGTLIGSNTCANAGLTEGVNCRTISGQGLNIGSPLTTPLGTQDLTWVSPQNPGIGSGLSNVPDIAQYTIDNPTSTNFQQFNGRVDANIGSKDHAAFVIYWVPSTKTNLNGALGYQLFHHDQIANAFSGIWNHTFSPTFLNEARANAAGWRWNELESNPQAPFGLPQINLGVGSPNLGQISLASIGVASPSHLNQWTYGYKDVATMIHGSQTWKFGFDFTRLYYLNDPIGAPNYTFYNIWDFLNDAPQGEGGPFQATTGFPGGFRNDNRENIWGVFFQDDWKVRPNLTLSAGLRWSYFGPLTDKDKNMSVLRFGSGSSYLTGITIRQGIDAWNAQKLNFGPQIGFNWLPNYLNGKVVLRGGFGMSYNQEQIANANANDYNPPGTVYGVPGSSTSPTNINPNILYATSSNPHSISGYPPNPHVITTFNSAGLPTAGGANLSALTNNLPTEYLYHYSLEVEMDLSHAWVANIGYMGSSGKHLLFNQNANAYGVIHGYPLNPLVNSVGLFGNNGNAHNNMMVAELKRQFVHNYSLNAQYTWAHSFDTNSGPYSFSPYLYNTRYAYGRSDYDIGNTVKLFGLWQPTFFHGNDWKEKVAGGWSLGGVFTYHTGFGWTPFYTAPHQIYCNICQYGYQQLRPFYNGTALKGTSNDAFKTGSNFPNPGTANTGTNNDQFNNNYFSVPNYANAIADNPGQIATAFIPPPGLGRNTMPGPRYRDLDMNLAKAFGLPNIKGIGEGARIEIRADFLNVFNTLNINPSTISNNIQNSNLGQATGALGARIIDFQARFSF